MTVRETFQCWKSELVLRIRCLLRFLQHWRKGVRHYGKSKLFAIVADPKPVRVVWVAFSHIAVQTGGFESEAEAERYVDEVERDPFHHLAPLMAQLATALQRFELDAVMKSGTVAPYDPPVP